MKTPQLPLANGKKMKIPLFVWKSVQKMESEQEYLETDGLYRVPGDKNKIQNIRTELNQVIVDQSLKIMFRQNEWGTFEGCNDAAVIAGTLKLFLRELPEPLLPYNLHRWQLMSYPEIYLCLFETVS